MAQTRTNIVQTIKKYSKQLFGFIRQRVNSDEDAEDILQDVWYQLSSQPEVEAIEQVGSWLYRVARNRIVDGYRKQRPERLEDYGYEDEEGEIYFTDLLMADDGTPETEYMREIFWQQLMDALGELPENQRQVFVWNELEDLTLQEIADKTQENLKTIISRKRYAVLALRLQLQAEYGDLAV